MAITEAMKAAREAVRVKLKKPHSTPTLPLTPNRAGTLEGRMSTALYKALLRAKENPTMPTIVKSPPLEALKAVKVSLQSSIRVFPFLELPGELRNLIYILALTPDDRTETPSHPLFLEDVASPPLAQVCREIRRDCLPIFFDVNQFHLVAWKSDPTGKYSLEMLPTTQALLEGMGTDTPLFSKITILCDDTSKLKNM